MTTDKEKVPSKKDGHGAKQAPKEAKELHVKIPALRLAKMEIVVEGLSPLISHKFSAKQRKRIEEKQQGVAQETRGAKNPEEEYLSSLHETDKPGVYGFPASAFKLAAVAACKYADMKSGFVKGAFHVLGDIIPLEGSGPVMRTDTVRIGGINKVADIRYRGEFKTWRVNLVIQYNSAVITPAQIANLLNIAGFAVGVGEWRPGSKSSGSFGMFRVVGAE